MSPDMRQVYAVNLNCKLAERNIILPNNREGDRVRVATMFGMAVFVDETLPPDTMVLECSGQRMTMKLES